MTNRTVRNFAVAAVAAAGAFATLGTDTAIAGRTVSPFAGSYAGPQPDGWVPDDWGSISISSDGKIVGTRPPAGISDDRFNGTVAADGTYELVATWNPNKLRWWVRDVLPAPVETSGAASLAAGTVTYIQSSGTIVKGTDGNLYGTTSLGNTFVWRRQ